MAARGMRRVFRPLGRAQANRRPSRVRRKRMRRQSNVVYGESTDVRDPGRIGVTCYSGYRGDEAPTQVTLGADELDVIEVLDRWLSPDHRYFKCLCSDGDVYIIRHDVRDDFWELTFYQKKASELDSP